MDVEASEGAVAPEDYPLKVVDTAGVAGGLIHIRMLLGLIRLIRVWKLL